MTDTITQVQAALAHHRELYADAAYASTRTLRAEVITKLERRLAELQSAASACEQTEEERTLREIWTREGVPQARQDEVIAQVIAMARPGTRVGPFIL